LPGAPQRPPPRAPRGLRARGKLVRRAPVAGAQAGLAVPDQRLRPARALWRRRGSWSRLACRPPRCSAASARACRSWVHAATASRSWGRCTPPRQAGAHPPARVPRRGVRAPRPSRRRATAGSSPARETVRFGLEPAQAAPATERARRRYCRSRSLGTRERARRLATPALLVGRCAGVGADIRQMLAPPDERASCPEPAPCLLFVQPRRTTSPRETLASRRKRQRAGDGNDARASSLAGVSGSTSETLAATREHERDDHVRTMSSPPRIRRRRLQRGTSREAGRPRRRR
jgi:hypothetical protein